MVIIHFLTENFLKYTFILLIAGISVEQSRESSSSRLVLSFKKKKNFMHEMAFHCFIFLMKKKRINDEHY